MVGGDDEVSRFRDDKLADDYDVTVRLTGADRNNADTVSKLYVPSRSGLVRLDSVVSKDHLLKTIEQTIRAHDVLRLKGFAALPGATARLAIQAVGPRVSAYFDRPWKPGEARETALVVIGESPLDHAAITTSLRGAVAVAA